MSRSVLKGRFSHKARSLATLLLISAKVLAQRAIGKPLVREWPIVFEIGTRFWRAQFNRALAMKDIAEGRAYLDSLVTTPDIRPDVEIRPTEAGEPRGDWFIPRTQTSKVTLLHFHGGGYTYYSAASRELIALLAHSLGVRIFAPDYRLTPEHPYPAQLDDALEAFRFLLRQSVDPSELVVCGDSAGGHLTLMTLAKLHEAGLPQPALAIGLSPWTDTGRSGTSQFGNDRYDLLQGYMTLQFSTWLKGESRYQDADISPIKQSFAGLAPIYIQAGGKEILIDMIREFAHTVQAQGGRIRLDVWEFMTHEFHAYGDELAESRDALGRIREALAWATEPIAPERFPVTAHTEVDHLTA